MIYNKPGFVNQKRGYIHILARPGRLGKLPTSPSACDTVTEWLR